MNQHIKQLLESAPYTAISTEGRLFSQEDMAVFAQALVRECAELVASGEFGDPGRARELKQYFGVAE